MRAIAFVAVSLSLALLGACDDRTGARIDLTQTLRRSLTGDPAILDPQKAGDTYSFEVLRDLYEGLTSENASGVVEPGLAERWDISEDGLEYRFYLRPDARWSDGSRVLASDVLNGIRRALRPESISPQASLLMPIRGVTEVLTGRSNEGVLGITVEAGNVITFRLRHRAPYLPAILANAVAYPFKVSEVSGASLYNGAYAIAERRVGAWILLRRNPFYDRLSLNSARDVYYSIIPDARTGLRLFSAGKIDVTSTVPSADIASLRTKFAKELQTFSQYSVVYYAFNMTNGPLSQSAVIRQALSMVIDREMIAEKLLGSGEAGAYGFVPPGIGGYVGPTYSWVKTPTQERVAVAQKLLRTAGYGREKPLKLRLVHSEDDAVNKVAIAVAAMWHEALGVQVELVRMEYKSLLAMRSSRERWDVLAQGWNADYLDPENFLEVFTCAGPQNDPSFCAPRYDADLMEANAFSNSVDRLAKLAQAERTLLEAYAVAPLYFAATHRLVSSRIVGANPNPSNHNYSKTMLIRQ